MTVLRAISISASAALFVVTLLALALLAMVMFAGPAAAAHCPHGQIYRVHLHLCVGAHSELARGFRHFHRPRYAYASHTHRRHDRATYYVEIVSLGEAAPAGPAWPEAWYPSRLFIWLASGRVAP